MNKQIQHNLVKARRHGRVRAKVSGTAARPRLSVFRSLTGISAQLIDDTQGKTLVGVTAREVDKSLSKMDKAQTVGKLLAEKALAKNIQTVVFDKGAYRYHGRVKALAEAAKAAGLKF